MENNKPKIEDDFKNFFSVVKNHFKEQYQFLDFKFLKDYDSRTHLGVFLLYNIFYIMVFVIWLLNIILGGQIASPDFTIIGFTKGYFFTGEFITFDAWRIHILINLITFFSCLDYGETERKRQDNNSRKFPTKEEILEKYRKRGWRVPPKNNSDGKD
jgi:hypothetical protein